MLMRVLPVSFGIPEPWMCSWLNRQQLPGPALIWWRVLAPHLGHLGHLETVVDRVFDQLARLLDRDDLHRAGLVLIRRHIDKRHPDAARGDPVAVQQAGMQRKYSSGVVGSMMRTFM